MKFHYGYVNETLASTTKLHIYTSGTPHKTWMNKGEYITYSFNNNLFLSKPYEVPSLKLTFIRIHMSS